MKKVLVTGAAGFIGFHVSLALLERGIQVVGIDNLNDYYDPSLKVDRLRAAGIDITDTSLSDKNQGNRDKSGPDYLFSGLYPNYRFVRIDLLDHAGMLQLFEQERFDHVVHLAAQAGVRYSLTNPLAYIDANITGFLYLLEACRKFPVEHLVYASSSSVYGKNKLMPFSVSHNVDHPVSLYAASKKCNELMAHTYSHLFGISATGLRFFTVYGTWGRPDMAPFIFVKAILEGMPVRVFNYGNMMRDFTYIDDVAEGVIRVLMHPAEADPAWDAEAPNPAGSDVAHRIYNIGNGKPVKLTDFIACLENELGRFAEKEYLPMQAGDVSATWADTTSLERDTGYKPNTPIETGVKHFVEWYRDYYHC